MRTAWNETSTEWTYNQYHRIKYFHILIELIIAGQIGTPSLSLLSAAHHAVEGYSEVIPVTTELMIGIGIRSIAIQCKSVHCGASN
jgi:hypothetical protein